MNESPSVRYDKAVVSKHQIASKPIRQACRLDLLERKKSVNDKSYPYYFDNKIANEYLNLAQVISSKPLALFQKWYISMIGWRFKSDPVIRRYNQSIFSCARKSAKSYLASVIIVSSLIKDEIDNNLGKQYYVVANKLSQARLSLHTMGLMVKRLQGISGVARNFKVTRDRIYSKATGSYIEALPSRPESLDGLRVDGAIVDESHALKSPRLLEVLQSAQGQSPNSIIIQTSTVGFSLTSPFHHDFDVAIRQLNDQSDRTLKSRSFNAIYTQDNRREVKDSSTWVKSNPLLPYVPTMKLYLKDQLDKASVNDRLNSVYVKNFNLWSNRNDSNFISLDKWKANTVKPISLTGRSHVVIGCDLSVKRDLTSVSIACPVSKNKIYADTFSFVPTGSNGIEAKEKADGINYRAIEQMGMCHICRHDHGLIPPDAVPNYIEYLTRHYKLKTPVKVAYDPAFSDQMIQRLGNNSDYQLIKIRQGSYLSETIHWVYRLICEHRLLHKTNILYDYAINNSLATYNRKGELYIRKFRNVEKIDPIFSLLDCCFVLKNLKQDENRPKLSDALKKNKPIF